MKLSLHIVLIIGITFLLHTLTFAASSIEKSPEHIVAISSNDNGFADKIQQLLNVQLVQKFQVKIQNAKAIWKSTRTEKKKKSLGLLSTFLLVLSVALVTLKLTGVIMISWLWALAPIWIPLGLSLLLFLIIMVVVSAIKK